MRYIAQRKDDSPCRRCAKNEFIFNNIHINKKH